MKIYVVTKGCYSDYHIITATTDENLADEIKEKFSSKYEKAYVEVFENAELLLKPCFFLRFDRNGNVRETVCRSDNEYSYDCDYGIDVTGNFYISVVADNLESAIKIGAEKRAIYLAQQYGIC